MQTFIKGLNIAEMMKKKITVMVKKKLPIMQSVMGLPNCKHHKKEK